MVLRILKRFVFTVLFLCLVDICDADNKTQIEGKIIGGTYTPISHFAHAVYLSIKCGRAHMICGASVLNQYIVLTAAHCLSDCYDHLSVEALAGHENLHEVKVRKRVTKTAIHREYSDYTLENDIALALLTDKLPLSNTIKRVILKKKHIEEVMASVAGWGVINDVTRERTLLLKVVNQIVPPQKECLVIGNIRDGMLCAGDRDSSKDRPTRGDSGSGLITADKQQIGIVSFRNERYRALVVYTDISFYYDWIIHNAKKLFCARNSDKIKL